MIYADYEYYCDIYKGTVDADSFCRLATRASSFLDYYTQNRAKNFAELDAVKMCCCALVDQYMLIDTAQVSCLLRDTSHRNVLYKDSSPALCLPGKARR